jgi:hypothetical protein
VELDEKIVGVSCFATGFFDDLVDLAALTPCPLSLGRERGSGKFS